MAGTLFMRTCAHHGESRNSWKMKCCWCHGGSSIDIMTMMHLARDDLSWCIKHGQIEISLNIDNLLIISYNSCGTRTRSAV